jgi:hypothetical protein
MRRAVAAIVVVLALGVPALASAQSAGDNQYVDPFAGSQAPAKHHSQQTSGTGQTGSTASGTTSGTSPATGKSSAASTGSAASGQLPRTGQPLMPLFVLGGALLLAGLVLRLRVAARRPRPSGGPQYIDLRRDP